MGGDALTIQKIRARPVDAPLARPIRTAVGTIPSAPLVLIDVFTEEGVVGSAYIFAYATVALGPLVRLINGLDQETRGKTVTPFERLRDFDRRFRLLGWNGLVGMAVSGLDMALWDALGKAAGWPVARLLGSAPAPLPAYDSFGVVDPRADERALAASIEQGFRGIKIKLGDGDLQRDVATVYAVRQIIGGDITLMVDYNQSLSPFEAKRRINSLAVYDLHWVEEPVHASDLDGHARVRAESPVPIQTGENWSFPRDMASAIAAGACDLAMLDVMKIGGVTGWMRAAALAEAASLPVSSHTFIEPSAHVLAATPTAHWLEHLDIARQILAEPCTVEQGTVTARGPGLGLVWDEPVVQRYAM
jgi:mandelate racemase